MRVFTPPTPVPSSTSASVFLAGSIEMGASVDWQSRAIAALADLDVDVLNPRRADWDASWRQSLDEPRFVEQVEWELAGLERASVVAMHFEPATKSPVTLLELGLVSARAPRARVIVHCPDGFWRKGNVDVVARRYGLTMVPTFDALLASVRDALADVTTAR